MATAQAPVPAELEQALNHILHLQQQGKMTEAVELGVGLLGRFPQHARLLQTVSILYLNMGQPAQALVYLEQLIAADPDEAIAYNIAGVALCQMGQLEQAISYYKKALECNPKLTETLCNLGVALVAMQQFSEAKDCFNQAIALGLVSAVVHYNLGWIAHQSKHLPEAIQSYKNALAIEPNYLMCVVNLAEAYFECDQNKDAFALFRRLNNHSPEDKNFHKKLGACYLRLGNFNKALVHLKRGFVKEEEDIYIYLYKVYGFLGSKLKQYEIALEALKQFPKSPFFLIQAIDLSRTLSIWQDIDYLLQKLKETMDCDDYFFKYSYYYILNFSLQEEQCFARKIGNYYKNKVAPSLSLFDFTFKKERKSKLRVGYISGNVRSHPNAQMVMHIFNYHTRDQFEFYLYSTGVTDDSIYAQEMMRSADHFIQLYGQTSFEAAKKIYADDIDILVDLTGYFNELTPEILAYKPARITIGFLDHCGTRGAECIDYTLLDHTVASLEEAEYYDEKLILLPGSLFITNDKQLIAPKKTRQYYNLPEDKLILTCFNSVFKYEPDCFASWMRLLEKIPDSVLLLWTNATESKKHLLNYAKDHGINSDRILFAPPLEKSEHIARLQLLDLFVDSFHHAAHSTAIDALFGGLPLVTLYGKNVCQRGASSILKAIGMEELITYSVAEYEEKIVELATNPELLNAVRAKIAANKETQPLFNTGLFTSHLERAYLKVFEHYLADQPDHIIL